MRRGFQWIAVAFVALALTGCRDDSGRKDADAPRAATTSVTTVAPSESAKVCDPNTRVKFVTAVTEAVYPEPKFECDTEDGKWSAVSELPVRVDNKGKLCRVELDEFPIGFEVDEVGVGSKAESGAGKLGLPRLRDVNATDLWKAIQQDQNKKVADRKVTC